MTKTTKHEVIVENITQNLSVADLIDRMNADPAHRLQQVLNQIEDLEGVLHVFYRSACYESDCDGYVADEIFNAGIADGGHMPMISMISKQVRLIYQEIKAIQFDLPE